MLIIKYWKSWFSKEDKHKYLLELTEQSIQQKSKSTSLKSNKLKQIEVLRKENEDLQLKLGTLQNQKAEIEFRESQLVERLKFVRGEVSANEMISRMCATGPDSIPFDNPSTCSTLWPIYLLYCNLRSACFGRSLAKCPFWIIKIPNGNQ